MYWQRKTKTKTFKTYSGMALDEAIDEFINNNKEWNEDPQSEFTLIDIKFQFSANPINPAVQPSIFSAMIIYSLNEKVKNEI